MQRELVVRLSAVKAPVVIVHALAPAGLEATWGLSDAYGDPVAGAELRPDADAVISTADRVAEDAAAPVRSLDPDIARWLYIPNARQRSALAREHPDKLRSREARRAVADRVAALGRDRDAHLMRAVFEVGAAGHPAIAHDFLLASESGSDLDRVRVLTDALPLIDMSGPSGGLTAGHLGGLVDADAVMPEPLTTDAPPDLAGAAPTEVTVFTRQCLTMIDKIGRTGASSESVRTLVDEFGGRIPADVRDRLAEALRVVAERHAGLGLALQNLETAIRQC